MLNQKNAPVILVDGSSYLYRAYHALPALTTSKGMPTGAIYGVINMLRKLQGDYHPEYMAVIFDAKGKTFRHEIYPDYKANRPPMPEELSVQIEPLQAIIRAMGLNVLIQSGCEADDVIGTLTRRFSVKYSILISTGDKDLAQLVDDKVTLINTMTGTVLNAQGVKEKYGVPPTAIVDYLALTGDSSDNIPGVEKVGPKTAVKWLSEYGSLDEIRKNAENIPGKIGENLRAALPQQLPLSQQLATIQCDLELDLTLDELKLSEPDEKVLQTWFSRLEFKSWLQNVSHEIDHATTTGARHYQVLFDIATLEQWLRKLQSADSFAFDTETTSLDYMQAEIVGVSFAVLPGEAAYVPLSHDYPGAPIQLPRDHVLAMLKPLLEGGEKRIIGQHLKYDRNVLHKYGIHLNAIAHDTMLESYVLDATATRHDMDSLAKKYLDINTIHFEDIAGKGAKQLSFNQIDVPTAAEYAAEDADVTLQLHHHLWPQLQQKSELQSVYENIEMPLVPVLSRIEIKGVLIDAKLLAEQSHEFEQRMLDVQKQTYDEAGHVFNLGSPKQIQEILFDKLKLPVIRKTPTGQPSTAEDVLQELADSGHSLPRLLLEHRSLSKLKSTYTDKLPQQINPVTGRVHTSYHQAVASTGRLSSSDPNLQNIPIRHQDGRRIRQAFIAPPGKKLLAADYSQIELRIMAHLSKDRGLLNAFRHGMDIHRATAAEVFGVLAQEVTAEQRRAAKAINFGLIYGMSAFGLAKQLNISRQDAQHYVDRYFERYPGVHTYMQATKESAREKGYVETLLGRRLYLPDIHSRNMQVRQYAERTAINAPMQGTAADIIKLAMIRVDGWLQQMHKDAAIIMQVHDELVFELPEEKVDILTPGIIERMVSVVDLEIPLEVETGVGLNWEEAH